ncbi:MAG: hypothetical protein KDE27_09145 [Planctomycetes bacterium]|nr:hypothetical protein [Planctomycetota bacterium]
MVPCLGSLLLLALWPVAQEPQPAAERVQPTAIDLGEVRVGAVVETSAAIFWGRPPGDVQVEVELPKDLRPLSQRTYVREQDKAVTDLGFAVPTHETGHFERTIPVRRGDEQVAIPVSWTVAPASPGGSRILVADSPFEAYSTDDPATFAVWRALVATNRFDVDYRYTRKNVRAFTAEALARVDVVLVGESSLRDISQGDVDRLQGFVCGGGRVVLCANSFFVGTVPAANRVCEPFGLEMVDRESRSPGAVGDVHRDPLTVGVEGVSAGTRSPTRITDGDLARSLVDLPILGGADPFVAYARTQSGGEVITIGAALWWDWISEAPGNARLLRNLLVRPPRMR